MDYESSGTIGSAVGIPKECTRDPNYISDSSDYIVNIKVNDIKVGKDKRTFVFELINFEKGELEYVPKKIKITNSYNPGIGDDSPLQFVEIDKSYRVYLGKKDGEIFFVCHTLGVEELFLA